MKNNRQNFIDLIIHLLDLEEQIENTKIHMTSNEYFTLYRAFQIIDEHNTNQITPEAISKLISKPAEQCTLLIEYYSEFKDNKLSFANFMNLCLPRSKPQLRAQLTQKLQKTIGSPEEQELIKEHLSILIANEIHFLQQIKKYPIEIEGLLGYPFKQKDLNQLVSDFGYKINTEAIWKRLDFDQNGVVTYEDMKKLFRECEQGMNENEEAKDKSRNKNTKLGWINNKVCPYHSKSIQNFYEFEKQKTNRQNEWKQIRSFLYLIKEHSQIYLQIDQLLEKLNKYDTLRLFELLSINDRLEFQYLQKKIQEIVGQEFLLDYSDVEQLMNFFGGHSYEEFKHSLECSRVLERKQPINMNVLKMLFIKLILLLQLSRYLKQQYKKKALIQNKDLLNEFGEFSQSNILLMARKAKVELSLEEVNGFFKGQEVLEVRNVMSFLK
ncbi:unnamed protein product (macronuclear) [Paramecium tetraurelia]|uniref:EF-hand domain-containing protein n=1 Tax=Paramecium tetraurelia TaxID=5888 RepID=A0BYJ8_PARTE|nr:uncharacterized protein GSPATT00033468001 [Paramecium tetraurelia]CAK63615.1 unnamed protein product [Paramecium tetraurelia]|eukprot:XP_001431013.1 hypothetical protein (macronuclear) [Paramecium tetraurelia strain d4-2]